MVTSKVSASVCLLVIGLYGNVVAAITMETVRVDNAGNAADMRYAAGYGQNPSGYGSVSYTYNIGKYEVTAGQYAEFLNKVAGVDMYGLYNANMSDTSYGCGIMRSGGGTVGNPYTYSVASVFVNRPVSHVSYWDACRFTNWLHNGQQGVGTTETGAYTLTTNGINNNTVARNADWNWAIASEDEWYKAAYYKGGSINAGYWIYPTSSNMAPGQDMTDVSGNNANYYTTYPIDSGKYTTVGGEFQNSDSPYGTFDQGGNLFEWNEAVLYDTNRGCRGGGFGSIADYLTAGGRGFGYDPTVELWGIGFRVVEVPEPASLCFLLLASPLLLKKRRPL